MDLFSLSNGTMMITVVEVCPSINGLPVHFQLCLPMSLCPWALVPGSLSSVRLTWSTVATIQ